MLDYQILFLKFCVESATIYAKGGIIMPKKETSKRPMGHYKRDSGYRKFPLNEGVEIATRRHVPGNDNGRFKQKTIQGIETDSLPPDRTK